jgi:hypothetical protein
MYIKTLNDRGLEAKSLFLTNSNAVLALVTGASYYLRSIPLVQVNFSKGSHPVSFQSFLCTVQYTLYLLARPENFIYKFSCGF